MSFMILELITRVTGILNLISTSKFSVHRTFSSHDSRLSKSPLLFKKIDDDDDGVPADDLELLMADLGVFSHPGGEKLPEMLNSDYIFSVFESEQPGLDEVKEAFDVFDENKDGFIDAWELQRVLCVLGLKKGRTDVEDCRKMIGAFDENADGRIDFNEFVKFMENTFC